MSKPKEHGEHARKARKTPKKPKPWDLPEFKLRGDESLEPIYSAVGKALSSWEELENRIAALFAFFVGREVHTSAAVRAYGTVVSFRARCNMVDAAARAYFHSKADEQSEARWAELRAALEGYSDRRNDIAHGAVRMLINIDPTSGPHGAYLTPGLFASKKFPLDGEWPTRYFLTADQIGSLTNGFLSLANRVTVFLTILERRRSSP